MIQKRTSSIFSLFSVLLLLTLLGATSCAKKEDKAWQYFGEATAEPAQDKAAATP